MHIIDMRSDTVTHPTPSMRRAMSEAVVGDDVFGEDPTVNHLEEMAAGLLGKEAALFVSSGTMANIVSQMTHCGRGDEMILGDQAHIFFYEQGGSAAIGGIHPRTIPNQPDGTLAMEDIEAAIRPDNIHFPRTRLIVLENTHNRCFGSPLQASYLASVHDLAHRNGLKIHIDGARIFNAAVALKTSASDLAVHADSVSFCLSKGLGAPVGSMICGTREFISEARRVRKVLGGGMRQAGVLAAAGIVALTEMIDRLAEDHANAKTLAFGLSGFSGLEIDVEKVQTNLVFFKIARNDTDASGLVDQLNRQGVRVLPIGLHQIRAVTNHHVTAEDIEIALEKFRKIMT